jgi:RNA polymerase sigma-70 factor, ECF subfamily
LHFSGSHQQKRNPPRSMWSRRMNSDLIQLVTPSAADDLDLVLATKAGDSAAFEELVARYDRKLFRIAYHIVHNRDDAQDVVQETFVKVFQNLGQFQAHSKFSTWLYRIAVNQSLMELRKRRKLPAGAELSLDADEEGGQLPIDLSDWRPNPEEQYKGSELRELLTRILLELRPALRVVFIMRDIEGLSLRETAEALALTVAAVKTRCLRARLEIRERLNMHFKEPAVSGTRDKFAGRDRSLLNHLTPNQAAPPLIEGSDDSQATAQAVHFACGGAL